MRFAKFLTARNLKRLRKISGLKQREVAEALSVEVETVSRWENAKMEPTEEHVASLLRLYGADERDLLLGAQGQGSDSIEPQSAQQLATGTIQNVLDSAELADRIASQTLEKILKVIAPAPAVNEGAGESRLGNSDAREDLRLLINGLSDRQVERLLRFARDMIRGKKSQTKTASR